MKYAALAGISSRLVGLIWMVTVVAGLYAAAPAYANTYNVKNYGAQGNGTTDDTQAISNAIAAANAHPGAGNVVLFPAGTYLINDSGPSLTANGVTLSGESPSSSTIKVTNPFLQLAISGIGGGVNNLTIEFVQDPLSTVNPALVIRDDADKYVIENNRFTGFNIGIDIKSSDSGTIRSNSFSVTGSQSICIEPETVNAVAKIEKNTFTSDSPGSAYGIYTGAYGVLTLDARDNTFSNLNYGIYAYKDTTVNVTSNTFSNVYYGIYCNQCNDVTATLNTFNSSYYGIYCQYALNLTFNSNTVNSATYGVYGYDTTYATTIESNKILSNNYAGIYYEYASKNGVTISGNQIVGNGSSGQMGIYVYGVSPKVAGNTVSSFAHGIQLASCQNSTLDQNSISNITGGSGINADTTSSKITNNKLSQISEQGIVVSSSNTTSIGGNELKNCATGGSAFAVINVTPSGSSQPDSSSKVTQNTYSGIVNGITWFIYVKYGHAELHDNQTNTILPNYP